MASLLRTRLSQFSLFFTIFFFFISCSSSTFASSSDEEANLKLLQSQCLAVPSSAFISSLKSTIDVLRGTMSVVSQFTKVFNDFRLSNAISDCLELLDFAADDLSWSFLPFRILKVYTSMVLFFCLSHVRFLVQLAKKVDCRTHAIEGFVGTNGIVKTVVAESLSQVASLVHSLLTMVHDPAPQRQIQWRPHQVSPDVTVAADGTGNYTTVMDAVQAAPDYSQNHYVIYIKQGIYRENVEIKKKKWNLMMVGDGMGATVITGNRSYIDGWTTYASATFAVKGKGFIARDMTFENTAGPEKHQAVALRSDSDLSVYYRCSMRGYQDTLRAYQIKRTPSPPKAAKTLLSPTGFSIQFSNISADSDLLASVNSTLSYLGRPWKQYSRTIIMKSYISDAIRPEGWLEWNGDFALDTLYYGEYMNYGPSAGLGSRVQWPGFHLLNNSAQAANFTVTEFIAGNLWLPSTGVKYSAGLAVLKHHNILATVGFFRNVNNLSLLLPVFCQLGNCDPQHPILRCALILSKSAFAGNLNCLQNLPVARSERWPFLSFRLPLRGPLATDSQHPVLFDLDLDVFLLHARHVQSDDVGGDGLLPIRSGKGDSFEPFGDGDGGVFEDSEGVVEGEDHVPEVSGVGHEASAGMGISTAAMAAKNKEIGMMLGLAMGKEWRGNLKRWMNGN
ncbi:Pectinesterase/pectinesterase inhibitor PPE8B [Vitis vinifera]|uniref:Pectinesterase n=1 Tax=Vitis vinifera TaxID=29760 RepID=A0A438JAE6_VITVI|nr:Pectinesterase/pectinesterase inhibitor PPE8B [Vitis vinifera]